MTQSEIHTTPCFQVYGLVKGRIRGGFGVRSLAQIDQLVNGEDILAYDTLYCAPEADGVRWRA